MDLAVLDRQSQAQTAIIGAMLIDDACIGPVLASITANDFPGGAYKTAFRAIQKLFSMGRPTDPVTLLDAMNGGAEYKKFLADCMDATPTAANVLEYCRILKESTRLTRIADLGGQLLEAANLEDASVLIEKLVALTVDKGGIRAVTAAEMMQNFYKRLESQEKPEYITTGAKGIDKNLFAEKGDLVGIGGEPSAGKTAFAAQWATYLSGTYRVGFFSLETNESKLADRMVANMAGVPLGTIKFRQFTDDHYGAMASAASIFSQSGFEYIPASGMTAQDIVAFALSRRYQVVFIDYLQIVEAPKGSRASPYEKVSEISRTFQRAAKQHNMLFCPLIQLNRPETVKGQKMKPTMHSFRDSGQIEQDLDVGMVLYLANPKDNKSNRMLRIVKNKEGTRDEVELEFHGATQRFKEVPKPIGQQIREINREVKELTKAGEFVQLPMDTPHVF